MLTFATESRPVIVCYNQIILKKTLNPLFVYMCAKNKWTFSNKKKLLSLPIQPEFDTVSVAWSN